MSLLLLLNQAGAPGGNNQALAVTLDSITVAASQASSHAQSLTATLDSIAVAVSQSVASAGPKSQTLAVTLDDVTVAVIQTGAPAAPEVQLLGGGPGRFSRKKKGRFFGLDDPQAYASEVEPAAAPVVAQVDPQRIVRSLEVSRQATEASRRSLNATLKAAMKAAAQEQMLAQLREALIAEQAEQAQQAMALLAQDDDDALCALLLF